MDHETSNRKDRTRPLSSPSIQLPDQFGSSLSDTVVHLQRQFGNRYVQRLLANRAHAPVVQRELIVTGENNDTALAQGGIGTNAGLMNAIAHYGQARSLVLTRVRTFAGDDKARDTYPNWDAVIDDAAMEVLYESVKGKRIADFNLLINKVRTLQTWRGTEHSTDLLTFTKFLLVGEPNNHILKKMRRKLEQKMAAAGAAVPAVAHPFNHLNQLPISNHVYTGIATIDNAEVKTSLSQMLVSIRDFNALIQGQAEAETLHGLLHDIEEFIDRVNAYDYPVNSIIPTPLVLALQTLRDTISPLRRQLNTTVAQALNVQRVGAGSRPDRHTAYADLGNLAGTLPVGAPRQAYNQQMAQGQQDADQNPAKTQEEALTAAAATQQYPLVFGQMTPAPRIPGRVGNVEYYDTQGNPWDQKTAFRGTGTTASTAMESVVQSIADQQAVHYPKRDHPNPEVPVGVLLDTTYVNPREYEILWMMIFQRVRAGSIDLTRLKEVRSATIMATVPALQLDATNFAGGGTNVSVAKLSQWSNGQQPVTGRDGVIRNFRTIPQATILTRDDHQQSIANTFAGTRDAYKVYSNGNGLLPAGQRYLEYSVPSTLLTDTANQARFIRGSGGDLYITGTHYEAWTNTANHTANIPFYKLI